MVISQVCRQLEYLISDCLDDKAHHVPRFFHALRAQLDAIIRGESCAGGGHVQWSRLNTLRPADIDGLTWSGLFEFVVWKLSLLLEARQVAPFVEDMCDPARFDHLEFANVAGRGAQ